MGVALHIFPPTKILDWSSSSKAKSKLPLLLKGLHIFRKADRIKDLIGFIKTIIIIWLSIITRNLNPTITTFSNCS